MRGQTLQYGYTLNGTRNRITAGNGVVTQYQVDGLNRITAVSQGINTTHYRYDGNGGAGAAVIAVPTATGCSIRRGALRPAGQGVDQAP